MTITLPHPPEPPETATWKDAAAALWSTMMWLLIMPIVVLHELSHVAIAVWLGAEFRGAGMCLENKGNFGRVPVLRVRSFFVLHDDSLGSVSRTAVTLAPAMFLLFAWSAHAYGTAPWLVALLGATGMTVISDVLSLFYRLTTDDPREAMGLEQARYIFITGGPDQWQSRLSEYR